MFRRWLSKSRVCPSRLLHKTPAAIRANRRSDPGTEAGKEGAGMKTETFDNPADFLQALHGKRAKRVAVPRAPVSERTGLSTMIKAGWNVEWNSAMHIR